MAIRRLLVILMALCFSALCDPEFDIKEHLSTTTRYDISRNMGHPDDYHDDPKPPRGCVPIHLNLVARHGTRAPTKKRLEELESLQESMKTLFSENVGSVNYTLPIVNDWHSSWKDQFADGELTEGGEIEMFNLGKRIGERYSELFQEPYHPDATTIYATQVHRSSQSAVAFGMGLFSGKGPLGGENQKSFSVITETKDRDVHLRFHECCQNYKEHKKALKPAVMKRQNEVYKDVAISLNTKFNIHVDEGIVEKLWFLCKSEAAVLDKTDQSCALFTPKEVELLEWADDIELHHLKGYGHSINYKMGVQLLEDVHNAMNLSIQENTKSKKKPKFLHKAKFRFAHAETVVPFTCLLGLFMEGHELQQVQNEMPVPMPEKPPHDRVWKGSVIAPYGANTMLVLYKCPEQAIPYRVQALHNEKPVKMPACGNEDFCPLQIFEEKIVKPHLQKKFDNVCFPDGNHSGNHHEEKKARRIDKGWRHFFSRFLDNSKESEL